MKFGNLHFLWVLWLLPLVAMFYVWAFKRKLQLIERFVSVELKDRLLKGFSPTRQRVKATLIVLALLFTVLALIRPKYGFHWEEVTRRGVDIVIALDVSKSMLAEDVSPNRMERAKREIIDLVDMVQGDRIGLVAFAGTGFLQSPLTLDYGAVRIFLDELDTDLIPVPGTAIAEALAKSITAFDDKDKNARVVILITDGEDHLGQPIEAAKKAAQQQVKIYVIGIGKQGGAPIPHKSSGGFMKNRNGEVIMTKLDEPTLQKIALTTGGSYVRSVTGNLDLESIYQDIRASVEDKELRSGRRKRFEERFQWPLSIALLLLWLEVWVRENLPSGRSRSTAWRPWSKAKKIVGVLIVLFLGGLHTPQAQAQASKAREGEQAYAAENFPTALNNLLDAQVEDPGNYHLKYNLGNTYYKMGDFDKALQLFTDTASNGPVELAQKSYYNLGNVVYRQGKLTEAVKFYEKAMAMDAEDTDAQYNLQFVRQEIKRRLEEQKKRQQQQAQNKQDPKQTDKQNPDPQGQQSGQDKQESQQQDQKTASQDKQDKQSEEATQQAQRDASKNKQTDAQNDPQQSASGGDKQGDQGPQHNPAKQMSREEAQRWLSTLKDGRKEYLQRKFTQQRRFQVEKNW